MLDNGHNLNVLPGAQLREGYKTIRDINDPLWPNYLLNVTPARSKPDSHILKTIGFLAECKCFILVACIVTEVGLVLVLGQILMALLT